MLAFGWGPQFLHVWPSSCGLSTGFSLGFLTAKWLGCEGTHLREWGSAVYLWCPRPRNRIALLKNWFRIWTVTRLHPSLRKGDTVLTLRGRKGCMYIRTNNIGNYNMWQLYWKQNLLRYLTYLPRELEPNAITEDRAEIIAWFDTRLAIQTALFQIFSYLEINNLLV